MTTSRRLRLLYGDSRTYDVGEKRLDASVGQYDTPSRVLVAFGLGLVLLGTGYQIGHPEPMALWLFELALVVVPAAVVLYTGHWMATRPLDRAGRWIITGGVLGGFVLVDVFVGGYIIAQQVSGAPIDEPGRLFLVSGLCGGVATISAAVPFQRHRLDTETTRSPGGPKRPLGDELSSRKPTAVRDATHIEFIGPPGSGKTAIHARLTEDSRFFDGDTDESVRSIFFKKVGTRHELLYRALPSFPRSVFEDEFLVYRLRYRALSEFVGTYPTFPQLLSVAEESVTRDPERIRPLCMPIAERYQLGLTATADDEVLCLDEGFAQRAASVLWRGPDGSFSLEEYFRAVPVPDVLIHVRAPDDVCIDRQRARGRVVVARDWGTDDPAVLQKRHREICTLISDCLASRTTVITVENTGTVEEAVDRIRKELD